MGCPQKKKKTKNFIPVVFVRRLSLSFSTIRKLTQTIFLFHLSFIKIKQLLNMIQLRPWLVESSVIVSFCVITSMCDAVIIINYFCIKKILFSKKEKQQEKMGVFFMIFRRKLGNL